MQLSVLIHTLLSKRTMAPLRSLSIALALFGLCPDSGWAAISIDVTVSRDQGTASTTPTTGSFSTSAANELLLAFVSTDYRSGTNTTVTGVTGGGLTWVLVRRTNVQKGTTEIWRAFAPTVLTNATVRATLSQSVASSVTIVSFTGVDTSGTNGSGAIGATGSGSGSSGAPTATLVTTRNSSWVLGVGNDFDNPIIRTPAAGQVLVHSYLPPVGDTYWVQRQSSATPLAGTSVSINDTAPTGDQYNLTIVEVLAPAVVGPTFRVSGTITPSASGSGAVVTLTQGTTTIASATADAAGGYVFANVANGTYTATPARTGFSFGPTSQTVVVSNADTVVANFVASQATWSVTGTITPAVSGNGATVTLNQGTQTVATASANSAGGYVFTNVANGTYTVTPAKTGFGFSPTARTVVVSGVDVTVPAFTATQPTWSLSGSITPASSGSGTLVTLSGGATTTADSSGAYVFTGLANATYTVSPSKAGFTFTPAQRSVTINGANATGANFTAQSAAGTLLYPDLSDIIPTSGISIAMVGGHRMFQYTHDTFNGGPGPLVIQPAYNAASGIYEGTQYIYSVSGNTWTLRQQVPLAGAFIFHPEHGHFHFPFAAYGLYTVGADGKPGAPVVLSEKVGFCIADSFIYDPTLPHAGDIGGIGSCSDPTSRRGLDIGAVDEYDRTDDGQSITIDTLADGTYWLRAVVDPNNFFAEANKANNETDVLVSIIGMTVQVLQTVVPSLAPPPDITLNAPTGPLSGMVTLSAATASGGPVQILLDGQPLGAPLPVGAYTLNWNSTLVPDGSHRLAAQTAGATGVVGTSPVVDVTVANGANTPPSVQITSPVEGATVGATVTLFAQAAGGHPIVNVTFFVDGSQVGQPVTAPPYTIQWDTTSSTAGVHILTATAVDAANFTAVSSSVSVTVDNTHPPLPIVKEATVSVDGPGTITTPSFSTATASDLLVAFVGYDGPATGLQSATVTGAGLTWTRVQQSNTQAGTSEIWTARPAGTLSNATVQSSPGVAGFRGSLTVIAFKNAAGVGVVGRTGAASGAPDIFVPGAQAGSWVFAVGNDWDRAVARTPVIGQVLVHQWVDSSTGDTYWVQSTTAPLTANMLVDIHDSAPTNDRWNYAAVEIVAAR